MNEMRRVFGSVRVWGGLLAAILLIVLSGWWSAQQKADRRLRAYTAEYHAQLERYQGMSLEEALAAIKDMMPPLNEKGRYDRHVVFTLEQVVAQDLQAQIEHIQSYPEYLVQIQEHAEKLSQSPLFNRPESVSYQNIVKTSADYGRLGQIELRLDSDLVWNGFFEVGLPDYLLVIWIALLCLVLTEERRRGMHELVYATREGRLRLAVKRLLILFAGAAGGTVILLGARFLCNAAIYGEMPDMRRTVQSVLMFRGQWIPVRMGGMVLIYLGGKILGAFFIGMIFWLLLSFAGTEALSWLILGIFTAVEYVLYSTVPDYSIMAPLKYVNLFYGIDQIQWLTHYYNVYWWGLLVQAVSFAAVSLGILSLVLGACNLLRQSGSRPRTSMGPIARLLRRMGGGLSRVFTAPGRLYNEFYKVLIPQKGWILIAALVVLRILTLHVPTLFLYESDIVHDQLATQYGGQVTSERLEEIGRQIQAWSENLDKLNAEAAAKTPSEQLRELIRSLEVSSAELQKIFELAETGLARQEAGGAAAYIVPENTYRLLLDPRVTRSEGLLDAVLSLGGVLLLLAGIGVYDNRRASILLLRAVPQGRAQWIRRKTIVALTLSAGVWLLIYGWQFLHFIRQAKELQIPEAPVCNLSFMAGTGIGLSIRGWIILIYGLRLAMLMAAGILTMGISAGCKSLPAALLILIIVLLAPGVVLNIWGERTDPTLPGLLEWTEIVINKPWAAWLGFAAVMILGVCGGIYARQHWVRTR